MPGDGELLPVVEGLATDVNDLRHRAVAPGDGVVGHLDAAGTCGRYAPAFWASQSLLRNTGDSSLTHILSGF